MNRKEYDGEYYLKNVEKKKKRERERYLNNRNEVLEKRKEYRLNNIEKFKEKDSNYYVNNREKILENKKIYREENIDRIKEYRLTHKDYHDEYNKEYHINNQNEISKNKKEYYLNNRGKIISYGIKYKRNRYNSDNLYRLSKNIRNLVGNSIRNTGFSKKSKTSEILGCSFEEFKTYLESKFESWMNWNNYGNWNGQPKELNISWDIDHIIPVSSAITEEELMILNHYSNLQPLCSYYNRYYKRNNVSDVNKMSIYF